MSLSRLSLTLGLSMRSGSRAESFISNNYYLKDSVSDGIGEISDTKDPHLNGAVTKISAHNMDNLYSSLSPSYTRDTGEYDNKGCPVLKWQQPVKREEQVFPAIPKEKLKRLDGYMAKAKSVTPPGQFIINIFNTKYIITNYGDNEHGKTEQNITTLKRKLQHFRTSAFSYSRK